MSDKTKTVVPPADREATTPSKAPKDDSEKPTAEQKLSKMAAPNLGPSKPKKFQTPPHFLIFPRDITLRNPLQK